MWIRLQRGSTHPRGTSLFCKYLTSRDILLSRTIRVWKGAECVLTLKGHEQAVWAVLGYTAQDGAEHVISASADKTLKLWKDGKCVKTIQGLHKDVVRGLTFVPSLGFSSCSNDG